MTVKTGKDVFSPSLIPIVRGVEKLHPHTNYVLGFSGGADSLALAAALSFKEMQDNIIVVIVDHQLQDDSAQFSEEAANKARNLGFNKVIVHPVTVEQGKEGMESHARTARYDALTSYGLPVLIGHTKTDQAETVLLGMSRSQGLSSVKGMKKETTWNGVPIIRPMLDIAYREDTKKACDDAGLVYWNDPHNDNTEYKRVDVRKNLIPTLKDVLGDHILDRLCVLAQDTEKALEYRDSQAHTAYNDVLSSSDECVVIDIVKAKQYDEYIMSQVVVQAYEKMGISSVKKSHIDGILTMIYRYSGQGDMHFKGGVGYRKNNYIHMVKNKS